MQYLSAAPLENISFPHQLLYNALARYKEAASGSYSQDFTVNKADEPLRDERATETRVSSSQIPRLMREGSLQTGFNWSGGELWGGQPLTEWTQETFRLALRLIKSDSRSQNALKTHKQKPTCSYSASGRHFRRLFYFYALLSNYSYLCWKG